MSFLGRFTGANKREKDRLKADIEKCHNAKFLESCTISKDSMEFSFKETHGEVGVAGMKLLGKYIVKVRKNDELQNVLSIENSMPVKCINTRRGDCSYLNHPHVNDCNGERICLGNMSTDIHKALDDRNYYNFAFLMNIFLKGVNVGDTLCSPTFWANMNERREVYV